LKKHMLTHKGSSKYEKVELSKSTPPLETCLRCLQEVSGHHQCDKLLEPPLYLTCPIHGSLKNEFDTIRCLFFGHHNEHPVLYTCNICNISELSSRDVTVHYSTFHRVLPPPLPSHNL